MADTYDSKPPSVLFATAEFAPFVKVGGLGEASSGLVRSLRSSDVDVTVVLPDLGLIELGEEVQMELTGLPSWCPPITARRGRAAGGIDLVLLSFSGSHRSNPYIDPLTGTSWTDITTFFQTYSIGVAALATATMPDVVHLNDWHTAAALSALPNGMPSVLTVHNLAYQGNDNRRWFNRLPVDKGSLDGFVHRGDYNPLAGGISQADRVVMVSNSYRDEATSEAGGCGMHERLTARGDDLSGIRNGIDLGLWNPADDPWLPVNFNFNDLSGKEICRKDLLRIAGLEADRGPVIGMVARLVHQKGVDLALELVPLLESLSARMILIGSGSPTLARQARDVAGQYPEHFTAFCDYDEELAHLVVAGSDLLLIPSRFEPCGLTQLQAMTCGTIPVATAVGGLRDTVIDTDAKPRLGTGFVAQRASALHLLSALQRACHGWAKPRRRLAVQRRGMTADWSWAEPAKQYLDLYGQVAGQGA